MTRTCAVMFALLLGAHAVTAAELTPQQLRGRAIYRTGESSSGTPITAMTGAEDVEVPATVLPCASCHGRDGRGRAEGGVTPSNLQWDALAKPYEVATAGGRTHPPYTMPALKRAITMGTDPARNRLLPSMPRYRLTITDLDDLIAYLPLLGTDHDPGITDDTISVGVNAPPDAREVVIAYYKSIDVFGRKIVVSTDEPFAIAPSFGVAAAKIPTITALGEGGFQLLPTLEDQCRALIAATTGPVRIAGHAPFNLGDRITTDASAPNVLVLTSEIPKTNATLLIPAQYYKPGTKALIAVPWSASDVTSTELPDPTPARATALAAAKLFVRALERAGRDVDRETLVKTLETFYQEPTGLTQPVTWSPTRHVGTSDVRIVRAGE